MIKKIVDAAVEEYNTVIDKKGVFHEKDSYLERRGMFYNCLRRQFGYNMKEFCFSKDISVENLSCVFREDGRLKSFTVDKAVSWRTSNEGYKIISELNSLPNLEYISTNIYMPLDDIKNFKFTF